MERNKRILIISHNPISIDTNMGVTLSSYFNGWDKKSIAQLFFRPEMPSGNVCNIFYQFTDFMALKSILHRNLSGNVINYNCGEKINYKENTKRVYNIGSKKKPYFTFFRNMIWRLSNFNNRHLKKWLSEYDPEIIFFAAGDYSFSYRIAYKIAEKYKIPLIVCFFDDYFIFNMNNKGLIGMINNIELKKWSKKVVNFSKSYFVTNDLMKKDYENIFHVGTNVLFTTGKECFNKERKKNIKISYIGNLGLGRYEQIISLGKMLKSLSFSGLPTSIDVYSKCDDKNIVKFLTEENGIIFHGSVPYEKVDEIISESMVVLHVESFEKNYRKRVKYSLSTKIADSLGSGTLLFAYGPNEVASIRYLKDNDCAIVATEKDNIEEKLKEILNENITQNILINAKKVFLMNHTSERNNKLLIDEINRLT